ncbi:MAG TPA: LysR family transcriptional regulator [Xanthobacteraceae bacterium]|nr:LysR family transcriptional regulator [Xanthobacteraceae bacterium]
MTLDLRKIEYFLAIMEHRNISRAAGALRVSQPTLSRQIHALEQHFKAPLFVRHGRGVVPTEAGVRLHEGLRGLERHLRTLRDDVAAAAGAPSGDVALGIPPSPRTLLGVEIVHAFRSAYPNVGIRLLEQTSGDIRDLVARGEVDLGIINSEEPNDGLVSLRLASEPILLVGPPAARLSLETVTSAARLAELPLILTTKPNSLRRVIDRILQHHKLRQPIQVEANTLPLMTDLVARGLGFTVLPSCSVLGLVNSGQLSASPLAGLRITWTVARPATRNLSIAGKLLLEIIFRTTYDLIEQGAWPLAQIEKDCRAAMRDRAAAADSGRHRERPLNRMSKHF